MRAERFGSYSMAATFAVTPTLSRLKSISRYDFFAPPPRKRTEIRPRLLRPPERCLPVVSDFSGRSLVISSRVTTLVNRRDGVTGLKLFVGMLDLRVLRHLLAGLQPDISLLPVRTVAGITPAAPQLARVVHGSNLIHLHPEELLHRRLDLCLVGLESHFEAERVLFVLFGHALLGHDGPLQNLINVHYAAPFRVASDSLSLRAAASDSSTWVCDSRSYTLTSRVGTSVTPSMLRAPSSRLRFSPASTSSTVPDAIRRPSAVLTFFVL